MVGVVWLVWCGCCNVMWYNCSVNFGCSGVGVDEFIYESIEYQIDE